MRIFFQIFLVLILNSLFLLHASSPILSLATFTTDYTTTYEINEQGKTHVTFNIAQKNNLSTVYATSFSLSVSQTNLKNIEARDGSGPLNTKVSQTENITNVTFDFIDKIVGKDKVNNFLIQFDSTDIANKQGSVWEINIPKLEQNENTNSQQIILKVPPKFGAPAYIDPKPSQVEGNTYIFNSASLGNKSISAVFGTTQFFKLQLTYNLDNPTGKNLNTQIALPPDTAYQTVYIKTLKPTPKDIAADPDGNWLASYSIPPKSSLQVVGELHVKLDFNPKSTPLTNKEIYTRATKLWNYEDPDVAQKSSNLTTPKAVYDYVTGNLTYNFARISSSNTSPNRPGASWALANPKLAICTEFTDLYIAFARKNNIPARELQGYAISSNDKLKPLSLSKDVLHAWPDYYDVSRQTWIQIDPTWGNTTGGIDYFNKLDLNHLVFAIHGVDPTQPLPAGAYKTIGGGSKDIFVEVTSTQVFPKPSFELNYSNTQNNRLFLNLKNTSGISGNTKLKVYEDDNVFESISTYHLVPYSSTTIEIKIKDDTRVTPVTVPIIIDLDGQKTPLIVTFQPNLPTRFLWIGAVSIALGFAAITWYLHLRRRARKPPLHW